MFSPNQPAAEGAFGLRLAAAAGGLDHQLSAFPAERPWSWINEFYDPGTAFAAGLPETFPPGSLTQEAFFRSPWFGAGMP
jgi:hypothetical protein